MKISNRGLLHFLMTPALAFALSLPLLAEDASDTAADTGKAAVAVPSEAADASPLLVPQAVPGEAKRINFRTALLRAVKYSPELKAALSRYEQAKWDTAKVKTGHNPTLTFNVNYMLTTPEQTIRLENFAMTMTPTHGYSASLVLQQALCTFGRLHFSELAARLNEELVREEYRKLYEQELYVTANYYVKCLLAQEQLDISKRQLALREQSLKDAEALFEAGTTARFDVLRVKTAVSNARQLVTVAQNDYSLALSTLCSRLGYSPDTQLELVDLRVDSEVPADIVGKIDLDNAYNEALLCRPEIHMLDWGKKIAQANYDLADTSTNPNLALQSTLTGNGSSANTGQSWGWSWATGLVFSVPILDGGEKKAIQGKLKEAMAELDHNMAEAERAIKLDVKNTYLNLSSTWERISEAKVALEQAQEADRVAVVRYEAGLSTSTELLDAHTALGTSESAVATARYGYFTALVDWVRAISGRYPIDADSMIDPMDFNAKGVDWYDLRKQSGLYFDDINEERLQEPSVEEIDREADAALQKKRDAIHESAVERCEDEHHKSKDGSSQKDADTAEENLDEHR
ncbi:TolC family protein [bacterium]|nr:TolC family protein [bacterium]